MWFFPYSTRRYCRRGYRVNQRELRSGRSGLELGMLIRGILPSTLGTQTRKRTKSLTIKVQEKNNWGERCKMTIVWAIPLTAEYNSCNSGSLSQNQSGVSNTVPPNIIPTRNLNNRPLILTTSLLVKPNSPRRASSAGKNFEDVIVFSMASSKTESFTLWAMAWEIASFILGLGVRRLSGS